MSNPINAVLFDLDGTLVDSLDDIHDSLNAELIHRGAPTLSLSEVRNMVGRGLFATARESLPEQFHKDLKRIHLSFRKRYEQNLLNKTLPYPGISKLLTELRKTNLFLGVLSNKDDAMTQEITKALFADINFDYIRGQLKNVPPKPDPTSILQICNFAKVQPEQVLYIGDTGVDMQTALNSGMTPIGVSWGYRTSEQLLEEGAAFIIEKPEQLLELECFQPMA